MSRSDGVNVQVVWRPGMLFGSGYDLATHQTTLSPFIHEDIPEVADGPDDRNVEYKSFTVTGDEDFRLALASTFNAGGGVMLLSTSKSVEALKTVKWNAKNMAIIIHSSITYPLQEFEDTPELDPKGSECLKSSGTQGFLDRYGTHFVAGQICKSTFLAVYKHRSETKEQMDAFKRKLSSFQGGLVDGDTLTEHVELAASMNIHTEVEITTTGSGARDLKRSLSTHGTQDALQEWQEDQEPTPAIAMLKHYSSVLHEIPRPTQQWPTQADIIQALQKMLFLDVKTRQQPRIENAPVLLDELRDLDEELHRIDSQQVDWQVQLKEWTIHFNNQKRKIDDWLRLNSDTVLLKQLVQRAKDECPGSPWKEGKWIQTNKIFEYQAGLTKLDLRSLPEGVVYHSQKWMKTAKDPGICKYGVLEFGYKQPGNIIIGVEILSLIRDHTNGYWRWLDGRIGQDYFKAEFSTSHWREHGAYELRVWYVDKAKLVG